MLQGTTRAGDPVGLVEFDKQKLKDETTLVADGGARRICVSCRQLVAADSPSCPTDGGSIVELPPAGLHLNQYDFVDFIAAGGMGIVYKARHLLLDQFFAVKVLHSDKLTGGAAQRFQTEAKAINQLNHPNLITLRECGVSDAGQPYMVMDYVEGGTLADLIRTERQMEVARVGKIFVQVLNGLAYAHDAGVLHRDLKPSNIMIAKEREIAKIVDFGIAKVIDTTGDTAALTQTGDIFGTPLYMSPEQGQGKKVDRRSDLYSVGCMIYEALTGAPPHTGDSAIGTLVKHVHDAPMSLREGSLGRKFTSEWEEFISKALAKEPAQRFQSAEEMRSALEKAVASASDYQAKTEPDKVLPGFKSLIVSVTVLAAVALIALTTIFIRPSSQWMIRSAPVVSNKVSPPLEPEAPLSEQSMPDAVVADSSDKALQDIVSVHITMNKNSDTSPQKLIFKDESFSSLEPISRDGRVQTIDLSRSFFPPHSLRNLNGLQYLERLELGYVRLYKGKEKPVPLTGAEVAELKNLPRLRELIFCKAALNANAFSAIAQLHSLRKLEVVRSQVTDEALSHLSSSNLERISVDDNPSLHGEGFRALNSLQAVEAVQISLDDRGAQSLFGLPNLTELNIINSTQQCKNLPFDLLSRTGKITLLQVSDMNASDLEGIGKIKSLRQLVIQQYRNDSLQDKDLLALQNLKNLESLLLCDFRNITDGGIRKLERFLPHCKVSAAKDPNRRKWLPLR